MRYPPAGRPFGVGLLLLLLLSLTPFQTAASPGCPTTASSTTKQRMAHLAEEIRFHNDLYYKSFRPVISDADYDRLFAELLQLEQCFPALAAADSPTSSVAKDSGANGSSLRHERPMLSLNSSTSLVAVEALLHRAAATQIKPRLLVQPKVDGLPVELIYRSGRLVSAATRGDGHLGADVTERIKTIPGIPLQLTGAFPPRVTVRGEIYADRGLIAKAAGRGMKGYATPRHFAAAALKAKHPVPLAVAALRLFPFELVNAEQSAVAATDLAALGMLAVWGFPVRLDLTLQAQDLDEIRAAYQTYLAQRGVQPFAADGIVVKIDDLSLRRTLGEGSRAPLWAAAWKFPPETARTAVREIRWKAGRTGHRTPVAEVDPVMLGGVLVRRVTLHNSQTAQRLCIAAGDRVEIALVGDIIPQVQEVQRQDGSAACPDSASGGTAAESGMAACLSDTPGCREHFLARAVHFVSRAGLNVPGLGPGRLRKLIASGLVHDLPSLLRLKTEEVATVSGFTPQSAQRLTEALKQVGRPEQIQLLKALGIPGIGPVAAKRLVKEFGTLDELLSSPDERQDGGVAAQKVRKFFQTPQGQELLRGLREVNLL